MTTAADLAGASATDVAAARTALVDYVQALFPDLAIRGGPLADLVLGPSADALAAVDHHAAEITLAYDPATALAEGGYDEATLEAVLAGRGVTREAAATATGRIGFVFSTDAVRTISSGFNLLTADGVAVRTTGPTRFLPTGSTASQVGDAVLVLTPNGNYVGTTPGSAVSAGASGNRPAGTALTPSTTVPNLSTAFTATDFTGGADTETDAALLARLPSATAPRTAATAAGAEAVVHAAAPSISDAAAIGFGHPGMYRGRSVLSLQAPGRMDLRVRTASSPGRVTARVTATLVATSEGFGVWQCATSREDAPGWFAVEKAVQAGQTVGVAGYLPTLITPGFDLSGVTDPPDVRTAADAMFSSYSIAAVVKFVDTDTDISGLVVGVSTRDYDLVIRAFPEIGTAQPAVEVAGVRAAAGDCLVRAASPVLTEVTAAATIQAGVTLTAAQVSAAVARAVNAQPIDNRLSGAVVAATALQTMPAGTALQLSAWSGTVYTINGTTQLVTGTNGLEVATDWANGLGPDAVAFYADATGVTASVASL